MTVMELFSISQEFASVLVKTFTLEKGGKLGKPYLDLYQEAILQFRQPSYSHETFTSARFFAGGGFDLGSRTEVLSRLKAEGEVARSGSTVTLRRSQLVHENHQRTTAFWDF